MAEPAEDHVWIGDLAGFEVQATTDDGTLALVHRCGWERELHPADCYLGNIVVATREHPAACLVHTPAPGSLADRVRKLGAAGS